MTAQSIPHGDGPTPTSAGEGAGAYVLGALLHRSALGTLHLARGLADAADAPSRVVRQLHPGIASDPEMHALLSREAALGPRVRSRNLVAVFATAEADPTYSVMEHVEGLSLEQLLFRGRGLPHLARLLVPAVVDALAGLVVLHDLRDPVHAGRALVHQAPVPRHILVGLDGVARLTDLTQSVGAGFAWSQRCADRLRPEEMAPEQALAPSHVDPRCDVFIAASTLWRVLTGNPLFAGPSPEQTLQNVLRMPIPSLSDAGVAVGPRLDRLIWQALVRARRERLGTAAEFAESLRTYAQQAGLYAERDEVAALVRGLWQARMLAAPTPVGGAPLAAGQSEPAMPRSAASVGRKATLVGMAPLPADVRAQLESAVRPVAAAARPLPAPSLRGTITGRGILPDAFSLPAPKAVVNERPRAEAPRAERVSAPVVVVSAPPAESLLVATEPSPKSERPLPATARSPDARQRVRAQTTAEMPSVAAAASHPANAVPSDDGDDDVTEALAWARARAAAESPPNAWATPAPRAEMAHTGYALPPEQPFKSEPLFPSEPPFSAQRATRHPPSGVTYDSPSFEDEEQSVPARSRLWGALSVAAAVAVLGAVGIGFRFLVTGEASVRVPNLGSEAESAPTVLRAAPEAAAVEPLTGSSALSAPAAPTAPVPSTPPPAPSAFEAAGAAPTALVPTPKGVAEPGIEAARPASGAPDLPAAQAETPQGVRAHRAPPARTPPARLVPSQAATRPANARGENARRDNVRAVTPAPPNAPPAPHTGTASDAPADLPYNPY